MWNKDVDGDLLLATLAGKFPALHDFLRRDWVVGAGNLLSCSLKLQQLKYGIGIVICLIESKSN